MQAIVTKYLPATNTKPARLKATCARGSITVNFPFDLSDEALHRFAAVELTLKFLKEDVTKYGSDPAKNSWSKPFVTGCLPSGNYCHVFLK